MNKNIFKSIGAVVAGFLTVGILSVVVDLIVEAAGILPPASQPEAYEAWHLMVALLYRTIISVLGGYITARLAPSQPMKHVIALAVVGTIVGGLATMSNWQMAQVTGEWYPIALLILSPIAIWVGGKLRIRD